MSVLTSSFVDKTGHTTWLADRSSSSQGRERDEADGKAHGVCVQSCDISEREFVKFVQGLTLAAGWLFKYREEPAEDRRAFNGRTPALA
jgi:hypothetical protein